MARPTTSRVIVAVASVAALAALAACGGDDEADDSSDTGDDAAAEFESGVPPTAPPSDNDDDGGDDASATTAVDGGVEIDDVPDDPAELAEPTGTITVGGDTFEAAGRAQGIDDGEFVDLGGDFLICEADNPAFPGDANIIIDLGDDLEFAFAISDGDPRVEFGDPFAREVSTTVDFERDGLTITGTAQLESAGDAEFEISCG